MYIGLVLSWRQTFGDQRRRFYIQHAHGAQSLCVSQPDEWRHLANRGVSCRHSAPERPAARRQCETRDIHTRTSPRADRSSSLGHLLDQSTVSHVASHCAIAHVTCRLTHTRHTHARPYTSRGGGTSRVVTVRRKQSTRTPAAAPNNVLSQRDEAAPLSISHTEPRGADPSPCVS